MIEFVDEKTVRKIAIVQEKVRPYRLKTEAWALSQAQLRGINTPCVLDYYRDLNGREVLVLEKIHGMHLSRRISKESVECMFKVGSQMVLLGDAPFNNCGWGWINPVSMTGISRSWQSFLLLYVQTYHELFVRKKILGKTQLQKVYSAIDSVDLSLSGPCLINRDIKPSNIIKDDNGKVWIVDWENAILGDPLYDLAIFGVKYGHGILWRNLVLAYGLDVSSAKYTLYEIVGLIGIIDFYHEYQINYQGRQKQLYKLIQQFTQGSLIKNI